MQLCNNDYKEENNIIYGLTAPRGRILDINGKVLVDNKPFIQICI